ncbi:maleylpyruvate isomerase N-terminal domain-containing protein [Actinoplanes sp. NEAU-A12]|uniref:Maleylpyruvate isomerase N-terminal domain-containing protein n=1 Tax=Actinoplanes sandaracinus TaxID=3045177 RepID=A0ABT6X082_9ACTN|nr:maleylpyruvate isomerase N-terminal domain-containing protein [Actinoplanes sandaracinus]MDI6105416.1 maleylpyruvate isomerase N-terminal domain-containing protein [Actinoplanes sandaracinus]
MTDRLPAADLRHLVTAFRVERTEMLRFLGALSDSEWVAPSAAKGWRIADVAAHVGAAAGSFYSPSGLRTAFAPSLERANDDPVARRRGWSRGRIMAEYERASRRAATLLDVVRRTPVARLRMPLAEIGRYPLGLMIGGALIFDHHTHLRHDMAPALGRPVPSTDADRMRAVLRWMMAVLNNQVAKAPVSGLDARVSLTLTGSGGGTWWIDEAGVLPPSSGTVAAHITAPALTFPAWGTQRSSWRDSAVTTTGDTGLAARFLDSVNIV